MFQKKQRPFSTNLLVVSRRQRTRIGPAVRGFGTGLHVDIHAVGSAETRVPERTKWTGRADSNDANDVMTIEP